MQCPAPGLYKDVPFAEYAQWEAVNSGAVSAMMISPNHGKSFLAGECERVDTSAMRFGRQIHLMILEPERAAEDMKVSSPCNAVIGSGARKGLLCGSTGSYTDGENWRCGTHKGDFQLSVEHLSPDEYGHAVAMLDSIRRSPANLLLKGRGFHEACVVFDVNGLRMKGRIDRVTDNFDLIVDVKKTTRGGASLENMQKKVLDYGYHRQAAIYAKGVEATTGVKPKRVAWLFAEDSPPYECNVLYALEQDLEIGWEQVCEATERYRKCLESGKFHGYIHNGSAAIGALPEWYKKRYFEERASVNGRISNGTHVASGAYDDNWKPAGTASADPGNEWAAWSANH